jgi:hypothetical protein
MIVSRVPDPLLRQAVRNAAHPEEEVVADERLVLEALQLGYPRLLVRSGKWISARRPTGVSVLDLDEVLVQEWEAERRSEELPPPRLEYLTGRIRVLMERPASEGTWADAALAELARAAGLPLPLPLRAFARRVFEFPSRYTTLHDVADCCDLSRGALKARFRRRGLASPYTYLRWFRVMALKRHIGWDSHRPATCAGPAKASLRSLLPSCARSTDGSVWSFASRGPISRKTPCARGRPWMRSSPGGPHSDPKGSSPVACRVLPGRVAGESS